MKRRILRRRGIAASPVVIGALVVGAVAASLAMAPSFRRYVRMSRM